MRRSRAALVPLAAGLAWLAYKSTYLTLDAPNGAKAFLVSPGVALLIASVFLFLPDPRRRLGGTCVVLGAVALLWAALETLPYTSWVFYTPYSSFRTNESSPFLRDTSPAVAAAILLLPIGLALCFRRSVLGGLLLAAAALGAFYPPSRIWMAIQFARGIGEPRRYHYYYLAPEADIERFNVAILVLLGVSGIALLALRRPSIPPPPL